MQSEDGVVGREFVLHVLADEKVTISQQKGSPQGTLVLAKDGVLDVRIIPDPVSRRMIRTFSRKFDIAIHLFYN
jgi:hypothetical protein